MRVWSGLHRFRPGEPLLSAARLRALDRHTIAAIGIPGVVLMENAGRALADAVEARGVRRVLVLSGSGNNGGDGFVAARHLHHRGIGVRVVLAAPPRRLGGDAAAHWKPIRGLKIPVILFQPTQKLLKSFSWPDLIIDALLGTGSLGPLRGPYPDMVEAINASRRPVVAADIPTGLNADTGRAEGAAVRANATVTFGFAKPGLVRPGARPWVGDLWVADIGYPRRRPK